MKKITVEICLGTTCFLMGASELQGLADSLPASLQDCVEVKSERCLGFCKDKQYGKAPYIKINGKAMGNASLSSVMAKLKELVEKQ